MAILRNIDVSNKIGVSPATVQNWIRYALSGKIHLDLTKMGNRYYIEDTIENIDRMQKLQKQGVKYRSKTDWVELEVSEKLYETFTEDEIIDIFTHIQYHSTIPIKYSNHSQGIRYLYEAVIEELDKNASRSYTTRESEGVNDHLTEIVRRFVKEGYKINLVEIGHDYSTMFIADTVRYLHSENALRKYISVSISEDIHDVREKTLREVLKLDVDFQSYTADQDRQSIKGLLFKEKPGNEKVMNICLMLSSMITNYNDPVEILTNLAESMTDTDRLFVTSILTDRSGKDKIERSLNVGALRARRYEWIVRLLGLYKNVEFENYAYDNVNRLKTRYVQTKDNVQLRFMINEQPHVITLPRDSKIYYFLSRRPTLNELTFSVDRFFEIEQTNTLNSEQLALFLLKSRRAFPVVSS